MNPQIQRADLPPRAREELSPPVADDETLDLDQLPWGDAPEQAPQAPLGGRTVLGGGLLVLAVVWVAFTAWSAGRVLPGETLSSAAIAQWVAVASGPLALLGLLWLMFGRTRRKEAERFTRSVAAMRSEARSLETLLQVLSQRIDESQSSLAGVAERLMRLGDQATDRIGAITKSLDTSSQQLGQHGAALDRAAEAARNDIGVLLGDLPQAEARARGLVEQLRAIGGDSAARAAELAGHVEALGQRTRDTDELVTGAAQRLVAHLTHIESAGAAAASRVTEAEASFSGALDSLLERTAATLDQIRAGVDAQSAAVSALVQHASASLGSAGAEAANALNTSIGRANGSLDGLSARVAEQERASQRMFAEVERGLALIDERFAQLAGQGDERANRFLASLTRARTELDALAQQAGTQDQSIDSLAARTSALRESIERLAADIGGGLAAALGEAQGGADSLLQAAQTAKPEVEWMRDVAREASENLLATGSGIAGQQDRLTALLASIDEGVRGAEERLSGLTEALMQAQGEASRLTAETGPALLDSLVQVREAAGHAAARAREAISEVVPETAANLSQATRDALEAAIREGIEERLRNVEAVAARAVESARAASDRLSQQMLSIGQSAAALEQHIERTRADTREKDSEAFARRVALLMDSMHSAAIDVGKILTDEIDDRAWASYLKGNRGVFTRRAVQLIGGSETRPIRAHYESDREFQTSVNRYVHDFEAMLRRVLAERDGGMIAVTLMSSDMGKLYAALAQAIERRR